MQNSVVRFRLHPAASFTLIARPLQSPLETALKGTLVFDPSHRRMNVETTDRELEAFLDETLPSEDSARLERLLRDDPALRARLAEVLERRDLGGHSLGAVWQQNRISCADRATLGAYVLGVLDDDARRGLELHLQVVGCRYCQANLDDMRLRRQEPAAASDGRRRKFFESSVGRLRKD